MRRSLIHISLALSFAVCIASCAIQGGQIKGEFKGAEGKWVYLEQYLNNRAVKVDSALADQEGKFVLQPSRPLDLDYYWIRLSPQDYLIVITDSTEHLEITARAGELNSSAKASGSENTQLLLEFQGFLKNLLEEERSASASLQSGALSDDEKMEAGNQLLSLRQHRFAEVKKWLEAHYSSPVALSALQYIDMESEINLAKKVVSTLEPRFRNNLRFKVLKNQIDQLGNPRLSNESGATGKIATGKKAPEIRLPNPKGDTLSLNNLLGKTVLIDFWASWCGPCRRENPNVVEAYKKYRKDGFEVFSVSLDKSADLWQEAIKKDGLIWPNHVSDLGFWNSIAAQDYGVHSIPFPVLVGKDGNVIAFGDALRGKALEARLQQIFGH